MNCNVELKSDRDSDARPETLIASTLAELARLNPASQIIISSFDLALLAQFHEAAPEYTIATLFKPRALTKDWPDRAHACGATYIHPKDHLRLPTLLHVAHAEGFRTNIWTVNKKARARELLSLSLTFIYDDDWRFTTKPPAAPHNIHVLRAPVLGLLLFCPYICISTWRTLSPSIAKTTQSSAVQ